MTVSDEGPAYIVRFKTAFMSDLSNRQSSVSGAIALYKAEPEMPKESCPLDWWNVYAGAHPLLANLAIRYLVTPATTVPCERIFSKSGLIVSKNRAALSPANVNKHVCLNNWLGL